MSDTKAKTKAEKTKARDLSKRTKASKALKNLKLTLKPEQTPNVCSIKGCSGKTTNSRTIFCSTHRKPIRTEQLRLNNITWEARKKAGKAGHHVAKFGTATEWAVAHREKAIELAKKGKSIYDAEEVAEMIAKRQAEFKLKAAKAAGRPVKTAKPKTVEPKRKAPKPKAKPKAAKPAELKAEAPNAAVAA
jgi:hypothetical protein